MEYCSIYYILCIGALDFLHCL